MSQINVNTFPIVDTRVSYVVTDTDGVPLTGSSIPVDGSGDGVVVLPDIDVGTTVEFCYNAPLRVCTEYVTVAET